MELKPHHLEKFKKLYLKHFHRKITDTEAAFQINTLVDFARLCQMPDKDKTAE